jgi:uncharacterized protein
MALKVVISLFTVLFIGAIIFIRNSQPNADNFSSSTPVSSSMSIPFEELTVPYLRNKEYKSSLGEMNKWADNLLYESFLTSYTSDGLKINGLLTIPKGTAPVGGWPAIVFVHGYIPPNQYQTTARYIDHVDFLARSGFVVFKIDLRGHGDSEGEPGGGYYSSDYIIDVLNARAALQASDLINKDKIGLWGHSMAGNVLMRAFAARPEIPAVVIWAGAGYTYTDLSEYGIQDTSYQPQPSDIERQRKRQLLRQTYGDPKDGNPFWQKVAATSFLNDLKGAVALHHAADDNVVNIGYSQNLNKLLDQTKVPHELHEYPSGGHNITGSSFTEAMQNTVDFFKKYLN